MSDTTTAVIIVTKFDDATPKSIYITPSPETTTLSVNIQDKLSLSITPQNTNVVVNQQSSPVINVNKIS